MGRHLDPQPPVGRDRVGPGTGVKDRIVEKLDAVDDPDRVQDLDSALGLGVVHDPGDLEAAGDDQLPVVRPDGGGSSRGLSSAGIWSRSSNPAGPPRSRSASSSRR